MRHDELRIGMKVSANSESNYRYGRTTQKNGCVGVVNKIGEKVFDLKVTEHHNSQCIGAVYTVDASCFDTVDRAKMTVELKGKEQTVDFEYGDLLVFEKGTVLVGRDDDNSEDCRGFILETSKATDWENRSKFIEETSKCEGLGKLVRIIKSENLQIREI